MLMDRIQVDERREIPCDMHMKLGRTKLFYHTKTITNIRRFIQIIISEKIKYA